MAIEVLASRPKAEAYPLVGVRPPIYSTGSLENRFRVIPTGGLPGYEPHSSGNLRESEKKIDKLTNLHKAIGKESYNPRQRKGYRNRYGKWIPFRRGSGRSCRRFPHNEGKCPKERSDCPRKQARMFRNGEKRKDNKDNIRTIARIQTVPKVDKKQAA